MSTQVQDTSTQAAARQAAIEKRIEDGLQAGELFTEMFRPGTLNGAIIVPRIRQELQNGIKDNILFSGHPGAGKTTLTKILCKDAADVLEINASIERGIDTIRDTVVDFATSASLFNDDTHTKYKVVVLEECDNMTPDAWKSLRAIMEKYHKTVRFIANCNYIDKIPEPIQSRFNCIPIEPQNKEEEDYLVSEYINRVKNLLNYIHVQYTDEEVRNFVNTYFPDMRSIVKKVQQFKMRGVTTLTSESLASTFNGKEIFDLILSGLPAQPFDNYYKIAKEYSLRADAGILEISKNFITYMYKMRPELEPYVPNMVVAIAQHVHQLATALDPLIVLESLIFTLQSMIPKQQ